MDVLKKLCVEHKSAFKHSDFETVKLEQVCNDGTKKSTKVPVFDGKNGMEALSHIKDKFRKACVELDLDAGGEKELMDCKLAFLMLHVHAT